jgi:ABC-type multidrug transport system fused ATPase/permease subunit
LIQLLTGAQGTVRLPFQADEFLDGMTERKQAVTLASLVFAAFLAKACLSLAYRWWSMGFVAEQQVRTASLLLLHYLRSDYEFHVRRRSSELIRTMNEAVAQTYGGVVMGAIGMVTEVVTIAAILLTLVYLAPAPALAMGLYFLVAGTLMFFALKDRAAKAGRILLEASAIILRYSIEALTAIKEVKLRDNAQFFVSTYSEARRRAARAGRISGFLGELPRYIMEVLFILGVAIMTAVVYWSTPAAESVALLGIFAVGGFRLLPSINRFMANLTGIKVATEGFAMLRAELDNADTVSQAHEGPVERLRFHDVLTLDEVSYRYGPDQPLVLSDVSLSVPRGTSLALVGMSGAGKTTLANIILGLHPPTSGRLLADGVDVWTNIRGWRQNLGLVPQHSFLFDGSIAENIVFGDVVDRSRLQAAVEGAQLVDLLEELPLGLDAPVGEFGSRLSGGQLQRVNVARALYRRPGVLVMDEATSALDNETERRLTEALHQLHGTVTLVVIAHRLSTVRDCDQIAFFESGMVQAVGSFDEVRATSPSFDHLVKLADLERSVRSSSVGAPPFSGVTPGGG